MIRTTFRDAWVYAHLPQCTSGEFKSIIPGKASVLFPTFQASFLPTSMKQEKTYPRKIGAKQQPLSNDWQSSVGGVKSRAGGVKQDQLERNPSC